MRNPKLYLLAKKIHRLLVIIMLFLGLIMSITGIMLKENIYFPFDPLAIRMIHSNVSLYFTGVLGIMGLTGLYLYIFPYLKQKQEPPKQVN